ncbi:MAG: hypothetical protein L6R38_003600 [Xanthoria sp. 2 TBL-2021]|nr:MAG: hypothetical protein L6R38_003600 [Xanthoria sp. 2 TBL-2021]
MDLNNTSSDPKRQVMNQIRQEAALNNARALINKLNGHCFDKCIPSPGTSLSRKEETCLSSCLEKYMGMWNTVSRVYIAQIQKTAGQAGGGGFDGLGV